MDKLRIIQYQFDFEKIAHFINNEDNSEQVEVWFARELQILLGYAQWENFIVVVHQAVNSCKMQYINVDDHFLEVTRMIEIGKDGKREVVDFMLTRYACYLIAQNGDPSKEEIAFAQSYFAIQMRKTELIEERIKLLSGLETRERLRVAEKQLSQNIYERGVDDKGFARIRLKGDTALFGVHTAADMKQRLGVKSSRPPADFLPALTITATLSQLEEVATKILNAYPNHRIFSFNGEMGAGKTTLIKALCKCLEIQNIPSSPTFAIVNEYWTLQNEPVYHFDFYRIERPEEAMAIGLFEYLESGHYCFMEWSEKIENVLDDERVRITIERIDDQTRKFTF